MDPLHGMTLEAILRYLIIKIGWNAMYAQVKINCFRIDPSINSSLTFLRKTPWARKKVEDLYIKELKKEAPKI